MMRSDGRRSDPWGFFPSGRGKRQRCFECGRRTTGRHHVVPISQGGTKQLPLCQKHHRKVHNANLFHPTAIKAGLERARARGVRLGAPTKVNMELRRQVHELRGLGCSYKRIAEVVGLSIGTVHRLSKESL